MLAATCIINTQVLIPNIYLTKIYLMPSLRQALCQALGIQCDSIPALKELESCFLYYKSERKAGVWEVYFLSSSPESQGHAMPIVNTKINLLALIRSAGYRHCTWLKWRGKGRASHTHWNPFPGESVEIMYQREPKSTTETCSINMTYIIYR